MASGYPGWTHGALVGHDREVTSNKLLDALVSLSRHRSVLDRESSSSLREVATDLQEFAVQKLSEFLAWEEDDLREENSPQPPIVSSQGRIFSKLAQSWAGITGEREEEFMKRVLHLRDRKMLEEEAEAEQGSQE